LWNYNKSIGFVEKVFVFAFLAGYAFVLFTPDMLQDQHWKLVASSTTVLGKYAYKNTYLYFSFK